MSAHSDIIACTDLADFAAEYSSALKPEHAGEAWSRKIPFTVLSWLDELSPETLPRGRLVLPVRSVKRAVGHLFDMARLPECTERDWLLADIERLAKTFGDEMDSEYLRLRLDVINTNACRKFHVDAISARLLCTYRGTGTQYGLGENGEDPRQIFTVDRGDPILLHGTLRPNRPLPTLLHRSPPIEGTEETRLVLVLDPAKPPDAGVSGEGFEAVQGHRLH